MDGSESMKNIIKTVLSIFLIILLANSAFGFAGMGGNANNTTVPQDTGNIEQMDLNNTTESDRDIIMVQHLIEVDAVQLKAENKLFIRETLIFRNIGTQDFFGSLRTWIPDGSENISLARSEMMTGGGMIPLTFSRDGNIINWKDFVEQNSRLPFLYALEYNVKQNGGGTISDTEIFSKKLIFPTLINYKYMEKPDLPAVVVKITKPEGSVIKFTDENGDKVAATEVDEKGEIFRFSSPEFKEINVEVSQSSLASAGTQNYAAYIVVGILIMLALSYPYIKKKLRPDSEEDREGISKDEDTAQEDAAEDSIDEEIDEPAGVEGDTSGKFEGKNTEELGDIKKELLSRVNNLEKKYESGELLDEEYEDMKKSYRDELKEIEKRLKNTE